MFVFIRANNIHTTWLESVNLGFTQESTCVLQAVALAAAYEALLRFGKIELEFQEKVRDRYVGASVLKGPSLR